MLYLWFQEELVQNLLIHQVWKHLMPVALLLRLPVGRGGVLNSSRFCFFFGVRSRRSAHG